MLATTALFLVVAHSLPQAVRWSPAPRPELVDLLSRQPGFKFLAEMIAPEGVRITSRQIPARFITDSERFMERILATSFQPKAAGRSWIGVKRKDFVNEPLILQWKSDGRSAMWSDIGGCVAVYCDIDKNDVPMSHSYQDVGDSVLKWMETHFRMPQEHDPFSVVADKYDLDGGGLAWLGHLNLPEEKDRKVAIKREDSWISNIQFWTDGKQICIRVSIPFEGVGGAQGEYKPTRSRFDMDGG